MENNVSDLDFYFGLMLLLFALGDMLLVVIAGVAVFVCILSRMNSNKD